MAMLNNQREYIIIMINSMNIIMRCVYIYNLSNYSLYTHDIHYLKKCIIISIISIINIIIITISIIIIVIVIVIIIVIVIVIIIIIIMIFTGINIIVIIVVYIWGLFYGSPKLPFRRAFANLSRPFPTPPESGQGSVIVVFVCIFRSKALHEATYNHKEEVEAYDYDFVVL